MENFQTYKPKSDILKEYIDSFYFHQANSSIKSKKIVFFPNTKNALTIYKNAKQEIRNSSPLHMKISPSNENNYIFLYGGVQQNYVISEINSPFDKIGIIFQPLGMNHFIDKSNLGRMLTKDYSFPVIEKKLITSINSVYAIDNLEKRVEELENFFLSQINRNFEEDTLKKAISIIENNSDKLKISQLVNELNIEEKSLLRKFKRHLNCTPKHYSKVYQFRKALSSYIESKENKKLTDLALSNLYYDQSDFIKSFKTLTGNKPSFFFKEINNLGNNIYWFK